MPLITIVTGGILCLLTVAILFIENFAFKSVSVFIPLIVGSLLLLCGILASIRPALRMHVMHAAVTIGLIGALAALGRGIPQILKLAGGQEVDRLPFTMVWSMAVICLVYVAICVRSFIQARIARKAENKA